MAPAVSKRLHLKGVEIREQMAPIQRQEACLREATRQRCVRSVQIFFYIDCRTTGLGKRKDDLEVQARKVGLEVETGAWAPVPEAWWWQQCSEGAVLSWPLHPGCRCRCAELGAEPGGREALG